MGTQKKLVKKHWFLQENCIKNSAKYHALHNPTDPPDARGNCVNESKRKTNAYQLKYTSLTYVKGLSENVSKRFREHGIKDLMFGHRGINGAAKTFPPLKDKVEIKYAQNIIYKLGCLDCDKIYIGQTKGLGNRVKQHKGDVRQKSQKTALCSHSVTQNHTIDFENPKILDKEGNYKKREHLESLYIIKNSQKALNFKTDIGNKGLLYANVITQ